MQTFLPDPSFQRSAEILDYKRLGKQRVECKQILAALGFEISHLGLLIEREPSKGWRNHPATLMWRGNEDSLAYYQTVMIREWIRRGYNNTMLTYEYDFVPGNPKWIHDETIFASHRSNLLRKDPVYYGKFGWNEPHDLPYVFPDPCG